MILSLLSMKPDSLFPERSTSNVNKTIDNLRTNTLLSCLDSYKVSIIVTTNFLQDIDSAGKRRFDLCVEFHSLYRTITDCFSVQRIYLPEYSFTEEQVLQLCRKDSVTPSDFATVAKNRKYNSKMQDAEEIFNELISIQEEKKGTKLLNLVICNLFGGYLCQSFLRPQKIYFILELSLCFLFIW